MSIPYEAREFIKLEGDWILPENRRAIYVTCAYCGKRYQAKSQVARHKHISKHFTTEQLLERTLINVVSFKDYFNEFKLEEHRG